MKKTLIAMSGGVDSSVAALLCINNNMDCAGATLKLYDKQNKGASSSCAQDDIKDAQSVANKLGIPFHIFDFTDDFDECVIKRFISSYESGATPNPCIDCNRYLKFERLFSETEGLGYDFIATGHYARIEKASGRFLLKKGLDVSKDQSYVLYSLTQNQLSHTLFPLGDLPKDEVRKIAEENGFINAKKRDSQDICFVPDGDYAKFIEEYTKKTYPCGDFVDKEGNILGKHKGIIRYTIGQRKGLGLSLCSPMYVFEKNMEKNEVILCENSQLFSNSLDADNFNWIAFDNPPQNLTAKARIRYNQKEDTAHIRIVGKNCVHIEFDTPQRAIAKGQAVVLYDGDVVLGGGTII